MSNNFDKEMEESDWLFYEGFSDIQIEDLIDILNTIN